MSYCLILDPFVTLHFNSFVHLFICQLQLNLSRRITYYLFSKKNQNCFFFLKCHGVILSWNQFCFHLPLVPEGLLIALALRADWTMIFSFCCCSCCCPLLAAAVSCPGLTEPPFFPQRGLPQGEYCEERGQQEVRLQLTAAQGLPPTLPTA